MFKRLIFVTLLLLTTAANAVTFQVANDGPVTGYFAGSTAQYSNYMNAKFNIEEWTNPYDNPYVSNRVAIGTEYFWGNYEAGTEVIFNMRVMDTGDWFHSHIPFNDDGINHMYYKAFTDSNGIPSLYVGFEDIAGGGDFDFNDNSIIFQNITPVPEPETYMMMILGLLLVWLSVRNRTGGGGGFLTQKGSSV